MLTEADRYVLAGRLKTYLGKHGEAVALFSEGLERHPDDPVLLRHRGHRYITLRDFGAAIRDLERAAALVQGQPDEHEFFQPETEKDIFRLLMGRPAELRPPHEPVTEATVAATRGLYKSTLQCSIYYHLGIARYLEADFAAALESFRSAQERAVDGDMAVAALDWTYMTLRRLGDETAAEALLAGLELGGAQVSEGEDFYLQRLRMYRGDVTPEALLDAETNHRLALATHGYGVGNYYLYTGQTGRARATFERVVASGESAAFGYIAAEADLARLHPARLQPARLQGVSNA